MGVSTDACLAFGIDLGDEQSFDENLVHLIDQWDFGAPDEERVELVPYCAESYRMWIVAVPGFVIRAHRGTALGVKLERPDVPSCLISGLRAFCDQNRIKWQEPRWLLSSWWS